MIGSMDERTMRIVNVAYLDLRKAFKTVFIVSL